MYIDKKRNSYTLSDAELYIEKLNEEARAHRALHHPFLKKLANGEFEETPEVLKDFTYQYLAYSQDFMRYLTATISQLSNWQHRQWLLENLLEESGQVSDEELAELKDIGIEPNWVMNIAHPELYNRFLRAIGRDETYKKQNPFCNEAQLWSRLFLKSCQTDGAAHAVGAMGIGTENVVKYIYRYLLDAINKHLQVTQEQRVFFDLHALLDDEHGKIFNRIAADYAQDPSQRPLLHEGMLLALNLRASFFDGMLIRAQMKSYTSNNNSAA